jgi:hypothetical protein
LTIQKRTLISPRIGFNYDLTGEQTTQIRGGLGIFTSRIPYVWPGASFNNNGILIGAIPGNANPQVLFRPDPNDQYDAQDVGAVAASPILIFSQETSNFHRYSGHR